MLLLRSKEVGRVRGIEYVRKKQIIKELLQQIRGSSIKGTLKKKGHFKIRKKKRRSLNTETI